MHVTCRSLVALAGVDSVREDTRGPSIAVAGSERPLEACLVPQMRNLALHFWGHMRPSQAQPKQEILPSPKSHLGNVLATPMAYKATYRSPGDKSGESLAGWCAVDRDVRNLPPAKTQPLSQLLRQSVLPRGCLRENIPVPGIRAPPHS